MRICKINFGAQSIHSLTPWDGIAVYDVKPTALVLIVAGKTVSISSRLADFDDLVREIRARASGKLPDVPDGLCDPETLGRVAGELAAGRKINAIKIVRDATRMGLKDAKDCVERMERDGVPVSSGQPVAVAAPRGTLSESALARVQEEIRRDRLIAAIKIVREETGMGLKESKEFVEDLQRRM